MIHEQWTLVMCPTDVEAFVKAMQAAMAKKDNGKGDEDTKMEWLPPTSMHNYDWSVALLSQHFLLLTATNAKWSHSVAS